MILEMFRALTRPSSGG